MKQLYAKTKTFCLHSMSLEILHKNQKFLNDLTNPYKNDNILPNIITDPLLLKCSIKEIEIYSNPATGSNSMILYGNSWHLKTGATFYSSPYHDYQIFSETKEEKHTMVDILFYRNLLNHETNNSLLKQFKKLKCNPFSESSSRKNGITLKSITDLAHFSYHMELEDFEDLLIYSLDNFLYDCVLSLDNIVLHEYYEKDLNKKRKLLSYYHERASLSIENKKLNLLPKKKML